MKRFLRRFKFQGLIMEVTLVVVNILLVLAVIYFWNSHFKDMKADKDSDFEYNYVRVGDDTQGTK